MGTKIGKNQLTTNTAASAHLAAVSTVLLGNRTLRPSAALLTGLGLRRAPAAGDEALVFIERPARADTVAG